MIIKWHRHLYLEMIKILFFFLGGVSNQVIIQGLRESGVFSSVIASAQKTLSKEKFLASIQSSNSSSAAASESLPSRKVVRSKDRKVLDIGAEFYEEAVPPLPPPGINYEHLVIEAQ